MRLQKILPLALVVCLLLTGCEMFRFETPEEIRQRETEQQQLLKSTILLPHAEMLTGEESIDTELVNQEGHVLARYRGVVPTFSAQGSQAPACERMTEYYATELAEYTADCQAFFEMVKRQYGEAWETVIPEGIYTATFTYQLMDSPLHYLCLNRTYVFTRPDGNGYTKYYPDIFLAENGWRLTFHDLFGLHAEQGAELVMREIESWCIKNEIAHDELVNLSIEDFWNHFAMTRDSLIFYISPFTLSVYDGQPYEITLDLGGFAPLLTESIDE